MIWPECCRTAVRSVCAEFSQTLSPELVESEVKRSQGMLLLQLQVSRLVLQSLHWKLDFGGFLQSFSSAIKRHIRRRWAKKSKQFATTADGNGRVQTDVWRRLCFKRRGQLVCPSDVCGCVPSALPCVWICACLRARWQVCSVEGPTKAGRAASPQTCIFKFSRRAYTCLHKWFPKPDLWTHIGPKPPPWSDAELFGDLF